MSTDGESSFKERKEKAHETWISSIENQIQRRLHEEAGKRETLCILNMLCPEIEIDLS